MKGGVLIIAVFIISCTSSVRVVSVDYESLFNDGNSKVWLINRVVFKNSIVSSLKNIEKDVLIFYKNGTCDKIAMTDIGRSLPMKASYQLNSRMKKISFEYIDYTAEYNLIYITEDSILMNPTKNSDTKFSIQIIPFQEL